MATGEPLWPLGGPQCVGVSPLGPGLGFWLMDGLGVVMATPHWSSSSMLVPPPLQVAPQEGQDVLDGLFPPLGPIGWWAG